MLARDGDVTGNRIDPARSCCAIHVGSYNANRESIYVQQQTISAEGYGGIAFSTNVPHTVRGHDVRETKQCTDCHVSKKNDNNAIMAQLLMQGTNYVNFIGRYAWVAAGEHGLFGVVVTEHDEPQAVIGSDLHQLAFPDYYEKHVEHGGHAEARPRAPRPRHRRAAAASRCAKPEVLSVQTRGEYLYAACGEGGVRVFDIAFIDDKAFSERITTAPVSPLGQQFYVPTEVRRPASPRRPPWPWTRRGSMMPENHEQPIHPLYGYLYVADKYEGLILVGAATTLDGNPLNNFLKRERDVQPGRHPVRREARHDRRHYAYVCCDAGLVVVDSTIR